MTTSAALLCSHTAASYVVALPLWFATMGPPEPLGGFMVSVIAAPVFVIITLGGLALGTIAGLVSGVDSAAMAVAYAVLVALAFMYFSERDYRSSLRTLARRLRTLLALHVIITYYMALFLSAIESQRDWFHRRHGGAVTVLGAPITVPMLMHDIAATASSYFPWEGSGAVMAESCKLSLLYLLPLTAAYIGIYHRRGIFSWLGRPLREHRRRAGLCEHCGYDVRATPQRCPECGQVNVSYAAQLADSPPRE